MRRTTDLWREWGKRRGTKRGRNGEEVTTTMERKTKEKKKKKKKGGGE